MDAVKAPHSIVGLVGLKLADKVQRKVWMRFLQRGPLRIGLLHTIFTEHTLACRNQRRNCLGIAGFGYGDEGNVLGGAFRNSGSLDDARPDCRERPGTCKVVSL